MRFFLHATYAATGEGLHVWLSVEDADTPEQALEQFKERYGAHEIAPPHITPINRSNAFKIRQAVEPYFSPAMIKMLFDDGAPTLSPFWGVGRMSFQLDLNRS